jgi:hypothetical protein
MHRARIPVELGRERQAHAAAGPQIGDLLLGESLDGARLEAGIGLLRLRRRSGSHQCERDPHRNRMAIHDPSPGFRARWKDLSIVFDARDKIAMNGPSRLSK